MFFLVSADLQSAGSTTLSSFNQFPIPFYKVRTMASMPFLEVSINIANS